MLAYSAHRRTQRRLNPATLSLIVGGHAIALAVLITAKFNPDILPGPLRTEIYNVPLPKPKPTPPPPPMKERVVEAQPRDSFVDRTPPVLPIPQPGPGFDIGPSAADSTPDIGTALQTPLVPPFTPTPPVAAVIIAARAITPADLLRPPYPDAKRRSEEEAVLRLRLAIDPRGRVTAVDPVGNADPAFLTAARAHLLRHWRYRPATEDGRAVASSLTITLRFELEE